MRQISLVGPRPVTEPELLNRYRESAPIVTAVRPGLTGLWRIKWTQ